MPYPGGSAESPRGRYPLEARRWQSRVVSHPALDPLGARLEADLRTRFPEIQVVFEVDDEGTWEAVVTDAGSGWGRASTWFESGDVLSADEAEDLLASVGLEVADNLWPDELTDPWPVCPRHPDHPLQIRVDRGRAAWVCLRDPAVSVRVGNLAGGWPSGG